MLKITKEIIEESVKKISELLLEQLRKKDIIVFGVVGGRSADAILSKLSKETTIDWERIHFFMVDDREVPSDDGESNFKILSKYFSKNLHPYHHEKGPGAYTEELKKYGGKFDVIFLSSGEDGHIGALYPNHHSIINNENGFIRMDDSPKMPRKRMTASRNLISKTSSVVVLFSGESKRNALNNFLNPELAPIDCPVKIISKIPEGFIYSDIEK